ncbi:MAG: bifunctional 5,10-methylenetetrahydrofolate dehydrogenase/5,10-methenyltetrahydrofolate cyclohydrolase [Patescibacteria group bacterium]
MKLDGRAIADQLYTDLTKRVLKLQRKKITPHLVVFLIGNNPASVAYVTLKQKKADLIGAKVTILRFEESVLTEELRQKVLLLNQDPFVHGILIQRPLPKHIDEKQLELATAPQKDVDGFHPESPFVLPLAPAVVKILEEVYTQKQGVTRAGDPRRAPGTNDVSEAVGRGSERQAPDGFLMWLKTQKIVIIGKGPSGGGPIISYLKQLGITPEIVDSKTKDPYTLTKQADVIIAAVGKHRVITADNIRKGVILIGVGVDKNDQGNLFGDYEEEEIADLAGFYTPTPGGTGPVNVAMLMDNLITAAEKQTLK